MIFERGSLPHQEQDLVRAEGLAAPPRAAAGSAGPQQDGWFDWLLATRHGGDAAYAAVLQPMLDAIRDRVLDQANLQPGQQIADIGSGDGLVGFGALDRQPDCAVTFIDISPELIAYTRTVAERRGVARRCRFVIASAEVLAPIPDACVDVVLVRAVIAYLSDKSRAIREFRRILRPGGRISIVDPICQDRAYALAGIANQLRLGEAGPAARYLELLQRWRSAHWPDTLEGIRANTLTNYNERDLLRIVEDAGFENIHLRLHIDCIAPPPIPWPVFLATSPRAGTATTAEVLAARFTAGERNEFERFMRPGIEAGTTVDRDINAYIFADTP